VPAAGRKSDLPDITKIEIEPDPALGPGSVKIVVTGTGLEGAEKLVYWTLPYNMVGESTVNVLSDEQIEASATISASGRSVGVAVVTSRAVAVSVPDPLDFRVRGRPLVAHRGSTVGTSEANVIIVEPGGIAMLRSGEGVFFVQRGGTLRAPEVPRHLYLEAGATFQLTRPGKAKPPNPVRLRFCYLGEFPVIPP
jgi:hypothetical protein